MYYGNTSSNNFDIKTLATKKGGLTPEERAYLIQHIQENAKDGEGSSGAASSGTKALGTAGSTIATAGGKYAANKAWDYYNNPSLVPEGTALNLDGQFQYQGPDVGGGYQLQSQSPGSTKLGSGQPAQPQQAQLPKQGQGQAQGGAGTNYGAYAQGAAGAGQLYGAYDAYKDKDYVGAGLNATAGAANLGAGYIGATQGAGAAAGSTAGTVAPYASAAIGAYNAYKGLNNKDIDARSRGYQAVHNTGVAVGSAFSFGLAGLGDAAIQKWAPGFYKNHMNREMKYNPVVKGVGRLISGKDSFQFIRDQGRKYLKENKILDENYMGTLADGSKFDFGKDGKGLGKIDYKDPVTGEVIAKADLLATGEGYTGKAREAMAMLYTNAALSNAGGDLNKAYGNMAHFMKQRGMNSAGIQKRLDEDYKNKKLSDDRYKVYTGTNQNFTPANVDTPAGKIAQAFGSPGMRPGKTWNSSTKRYDSNKRRK